jgi:hypothetical protein
MIEIGIGGYLLIIRMGLIGSAALLGGFSVLYAASFNYLMEKRSATLTSPVNHRPGGADGV